MSGRLTRQAWRWLEQELDRWSADNSCACFWWRDDDAGQNRAELGRLLELADRHRLPLAIAAIPTLIEDATVDRLNAAAGIDVFQHGYAHRTHALPGQLRLELGGERGAGEILAELEHGLASMQERFGAAFRAVLVPPWNRIDDQVIGGLAKTGFRGLSTHKARRSARPAAGLLQVNTHLDPVHWRGNSGFIGVYPAIAILVQHLIAKRTGYRDADEPTGILSHHLAMNDATWAFLDDLFRFLDEHPAAEFVGAGEIWG